MEEKKKTEKVEKIIDKVKNGTIIDKLVYLQQNLVVSKENVNNFGKFNYRTVSDILIQLKPLLDEIECAIVLTDEMINTDTRHYIKATAKLIDAKSKEEFCVTSFAREAEKQSGMGEAQLTGGASTYARKYALNGLLAIDDTLDPDTDKVSKAIKKDEALKVNEKTGEIDVDTESATKKLIKLVKKDEEE